MKNLVITLVSVLGFVNAYAQQIPVYSQSFLNHYLINPAAVAADNDMKFMLHHRQQWVGLQDAPKTSALTFETPIGGDKYAIGLKVNSDQVHIFNSTSGNVAFRYALPINSEHLLSFGLAGAFIQKKVDFTKIRVEDQTEANLLNYNSSQMSFDADFGLYYQWTNLKAGLAVNQLLNSGFKYEDDIAQETTTYNNLRHFNIFAGYDFKLKSKPIVITPTLFVRHVQGAGMPLELNTVVKWDNKYWGGLGYRQNFGVVFIAGAQVFDQLIVGYSYDLSTSAIKDYNNGSHEVSIGYRFAKASKSTGNNAQISRNLRAQQEDISALQEENKKLNKQLKEQEKAMQAQKKEVVELKKIYESEKPEMDKIIEENAVKSGSEPNTNTSSKNSKATNNSVKSGTSSSAAAVATLTSADKARIDQLEKEIAELKKQLADDSQNNATANNSELESIRKEIDELKKAQPSTTGSTSSAGDKNTNGDIAQFNHFYTVVGSYFKIEDAKAYQRMLKRETGVDTKIVSREDRKFFFVYTKEYDNQEEALKEMELMKTGVLKDKINGNFWVHGRK